MKRTIILLISIMLLGIAPVFADLGVGFILGSPTGISVLYGNRIAGAAAWNLPGERVHLHGDVWLLHQPLVDPLDWYLGVGAKVQFAANRDEAVRAGIRVPIGVQWYFAPQFELFGEIVPGMNLIPATRFDAEGGVGLRFHF